MRKILLTAIAMAALPALAEAACFVEYKAKRDNPLRLHYGILQIDGACPPGREIQRAAQRRLDAGGWTLLNVIGAAQTPPDASKRANAGAYFLRF